MYFGGKINTTNAVSRIIFELRVFLCIFRQLSPNPPCSSTHHLTPEGRSSGTGIATEMSVHVSRTTPILTTVSKYTYIGDFSSYQLLCLLGMINEKPVFDLFVMDMEKVVQRCFLHQCICVRSPLY